jgi:hypothetical protein
MKSVKEYYQKYFNLTVNEAFDLLYDLGILDETILKWNSEESKMEKTTPWGLLTNIQDNLVIRNMGPVQFCGGPPSELSWLTGTLLSYVLDRIMAQDLKYELRLSNLCG